MSTAKTGLNWSRTVERYVPRSLPLCPMLATVMSTAREKTRGNPHLEHRYYLDYLPYNFQKVKKSMASSRYVRKKKWSVCSVNKTQRTLSEQFQQIYGIMMSIKFGCGHIWIIMSMLTSLFDTS